MKSKKQQTSLERRQSFRKRVKEAAAQDRDLRQKFLAQAFLAGEKSRGDAK